MVPHISDTHGQPTIAIPLVLVVLASVIKDGIEDRKRASADHYQNSQNVQRFDRDLLSIDNWKNLRVGHLVMINRNQAIPADLILLKAS